MGIDGIAAVQSRIAAIEGRIAALSGGGRPPVAITESGSAALGNSTNKKASATSDTEFSAALRAQISQTKATTSTPSTGAGVLQGVPGTAEAFVTKLKNYLGVPYVWGGTDPKTGLDCSGLVQVAAREVGVNLPRVTWDQQNAGKEVPSLDQAKPGDLLITRNGAHVAVFLGGSQAIQAPRPGKNVEITSVASLGPIKTIRRVMPSAGDTTAAESPSSANVSALLGGGLGTANTIADSSRLSALGSALGVKGLEGAGLNAQQLSQVAAATTQLSGLGVLNNPTNAQSLLGRSAANLGV